MSFFHVFLVCETDDKQIVTRHDDVAVHDRPLHLLNPSRVLGNVQFAPCLSPVFEPLDHHEVDTQMGLFGSSCHPLPLSTFSSSACSTSVICYN